MVITAHNNAPVFNAVLKGVYMDMQEVLAKFEELSQRVALLEAAQKTRTEHKNNSSSLIRDMTKDDARNVLNGDTKDLSHKEAAEKLGLTYAQVYSCRLGYTFKDIHKELRDQGVETDWKKRKITE